ncbi:ParB N-terminal domain-containing protein [Methylosinus sp. Sm6]|uniref:ParB/RepB/Spo0J family partition protein n=1 Tax=Methylosinus sp. Sm6 TaxID=2866948 RepID=UPI001C99A9A6|nr:ParB N-terminal domain-containing protein [Methylosinus sp. Sm6]
MADPLRIPLFDIDSSNRIRQVDPDWAAAIAGSIQAKGLDSPIVIRRCGAGYRLVSGAHRLRAFTLLGVEELIEGEHFKLVEQSDEEAELSEIDENLMRRELSTVDRAIFLARRKTVWDRLYPETTKTGPRKLGTSCPQFTPQNFSKDAAEKTGLSKRTINRALELAKLPDAVLSLIRATKLADNGAQLRALCRETEENQKAIAELIAAGKGKNVGNARQLLGLSKPSERDPHVATANKLLALWNRASPRARKIFEQAIGLVEEADEESQAA